MFQWIAQSLVWYLTAYRIYREYIYYKEGGLAFLLLISYNMPWHWSSFISVWHMYLAMYLLKRDHTASWKCPYHKGTIPNWNIPDNVYNLINIQNALTISIDRIQALFRKWCLWSIFMTHYAFIALRYPISYHFYVPCLHPSDKSYFLGTGSF